MAVEGRLVQLERFEIVPDRPRISFKTWVQRARRTDDPAGDFIEDTRRRPVLAQLPENFRSAVGLKRFVRQRINAFADDEVMAAAGEVWQRYQRYLKGKA